jgi:hypothetical protein
VSSGAKTFRTALRVPRFIYESATSGPMADNERVSRRTTLRTLGTTAAVATGLSTAGAAARRQEESTGSPEQSVGAERTGFYSGTVDRVVDGEHVVILVEAGGRVIDQHVVPSEEYPSLEEGDAVYLFILFGRVIAVWEVPGE